VSDAWSWWRESSLGLGDHPSFSSTCTGLWQTDGMLSAGLYSRLSNGITTYAFAPGDYHSLCQRMDLTGMSAIVFDVRLIAQPDWGPFEHFEASLLVDGVPLWRETEGGVYLDQRANVSQLTGWHLVELRITALDSGAFHLAYWTQWDNIELIEGPTVVKAFVGLDPGTLNLASQGKWITGYIELEEGFDAVLVKNRVGVKAGTVACDFQGAPGHSGQGRPLVSEHRADDAVMAGGSAVAEHLMTFLPLQRLSHQKLGKGVGRQNGVVRGNDKKLPLGRVNGLD